MLQMDTVCYNLLESLVALPQESFDCFDLHSRGLARSLLDELLEPTGLPIERHVQSLKDATEQDIKSTSYHLVTLSHRTAYFIARILACCVRMALPHDDTKKQRQLAIKELDMALIVAGQPILHIPIHECIRTLQHSILPPVMPSESFQAIPDCVHLRYPLEKQECMDMIAFRKHHTDARVPLCFTEALSHWPALKSWSRVEYWYSHVGPDRWVVIEEGPHYTDAQWTQRIISFSEFISQIISPNSQLVYLAQYDLFSQCPALNPDLFTPDYCCWGEDSVTRNLWMGPKGTISPLHTDPHDNLFCQIVGFKYIRLYSPEYTQHLYPHNDAMLHNTSQIIHVEQPDEQTFPLFSQAPYIECIVGPGDMLYIPAGWWHYVRSLSVSISVSFWF